MKDFKKKICMMALISFLLILGACAAEEEKGEASEEKIDIVTTIAQIGEPLSVIGGDRVNVESLMGPSVDPHLYNPTQSDVAKVGEAEMVFYNGLHLEANMVDMFNEISEEKPVLAIGESLQEKDLLMDEQGAIDPHVWFDLNLWEEALGAAVEEMKKFAPEDADYFEENKQEYFNKLVEVKQEAEKLADIPDERRVLVTAHDAFGYFGSMHDMEVVGLQGLSTDGEIGISDINETIDIIREHQVPAIFVESSINDSSIQAVIEGAGSAGIEVELGGELFSDAMGEAGTEEGTYIGMYLHNIETIYNALHGGDE